MAVSAQDLVFCFDMNRIETIGGVRYLWDYSPNAFHFQFPGGAADPTPQLDSSLSFDGGDYLALPAARLAEFYARMPTREHTWIFRGGSTVLAAAVARIFSCWNSTGGGVDKGIFAGLVTTALNQPARAYQCQGAAAQPYIVSAAAEPYIRGYHGVAAMTVEATPRGVHNQAIASYVWGAGAFGTTIYDTTVIPRIGMDPAGTNALTGRCSYLTLLRGAASYADVAQLSRLLFEGVRPFCTRGS